MLHNMTTEPDRLIRKERSDNVSMSKDTTGENNEIPIAVMLFTPNMKDTVTHYHVEFDLAQAKALMAWLNWFVKTTEEERSS
jgi:hypothetical protein